MERALFSLTGKTALVSGGSRGIGLAIAKALAQYEADIAIIARNKSGLEAAREQIQAGPAAPAASFCRSKNGGGKTAGQKKVWTFSFDLENTEAIGPLFEKITSETNGIDILVNCAGVIGRAAAEDVKLASWNQVIRVNLTAAFVMSQAFCRHRRQLNKGGKIINIGSLMCQAARPTTTAYAASKGGLLMLTKSLAVEWAKYNINVNAIGPGYIATDLTAELQADEDFNKWVLSKTPLERWGQPGDIAGAAVFLASSASDFVTGQIIYVDGGWLAAI